MNKEPQDNPAPSGMPGGDPRMNGGGFAGWQGGACPHCGGGGYPPQGMPAQGPGWGYGPPPWYGWPQPPWAGAAHAGHHHPHHPPHHQPVPPAPPTEKGSGLASLLKSPLSALGELLDLDDQEFWKGALVGVAAVLLMSGQSAGASDASRDDQNKPTQGEK